MCDLPRFNVEKNMYWKTERYFEQLREWGWKIHRLFGGDGCNNRYNIQFTRMTFCMENNTLSQFQYEVSISYVKHKNGKLLYVINNSDYYWTEDEVIKELKRIGIK